MFVEKIEISTSDYNRGSSNMNDILRIYGYLLKNHPESASQILYGVTLIQQYLGKSVDDLKDDMKKAVDDETYNDNIYEYYKTVIDTNNDYKKLLTHEDNKKRGILLRKTDLQNAVSFILLTVYPVLRMKKQII